MIRPAALILAGGEGSRLGGARKATLKFAGERLIDCIGNVLAPHCGELLVSTGPANRPTFLPPPGMTALADPELSIGGPLAGVIAVAGWLNTVADPPDLIVTVAVDTPLLPFDFVPTLVARLPAGSPAAYVTHGDNFYPTNAIWRRPALEGLAAAVDRGTSPKSLRALLESVGAAAIPWRTTEPSDDPFANINTFADLMRLTRRARREIGLSGENPS